jgi:hypothetical protein
VVRNDDPIISLNILYRYISQSGRKNARSLILCPFPFLLVLYFYFCWAILPLSPITPTSPDLLLFVLIIWLLIHQVIVILQH